MKLACSSVGSSQITYSGPLLYIVRSQWNGLPPKSPERLLRDQGIVLLLCVLPVSVSDRQNHVTEPIRTVRGCREHPRHFGTALHASPEEVIQPVGAESIASAHCNT